MTKGSIKDVKPQVEQNPTTAGPNRQEPNRQEIKRNPKKQDIRRNEVKKPEGMLKIIPLGGIGEIGKNMTAFEWEDDIIVVDCGLAFPREDMLGVDYVIPDTTYLERNRSKLRAFIITHGHEDHIGATPYVLRHFAVPLYGTRLTLALVETKLQEHGVKGVNYNIVKPNDKIRCGEFTVEFIKVSHSIDDAVGLAIDSPAGVVVHTGDFKVDFTPVDGKLIDMHKFAEYGKRGVLALISDSTNAEREGYTISERSVGMALENYFKEAKGRIIVATFASNIHRLQQVVDEAKRYNRKICLSGRSMIRIANVATELGYIKLPEKMQISMDELSEMKDNRVVILTTGSQGEPMSGLVRMASGDHTKISIKSGDKVIISSTPIPGNERYVSDVINMLYRRGADVIYGGLAKVHVSGHACQEELKLMIGLVKPKYFIPCHGEYRHLYKHAQLAESMGIKKNNIFIPEIGKAIEMNTHQAYFGGIVPSGSILIDGLGIGDVGNVVLRDRKLLSSDGLFIAIVTIAKDRSEVVAEPEIISRGFVYMRESEDLLDEAKKIVKRVVEECTSDNIHEWLAIKGKIKKSLSSYLYTMTKRSPMILPVIIEV